MVMVWGLELAFLEEEVEWVMKLLFPKDLIVGIDSLLEWACPGKGFNYSEYYADEDEGEVQGKFGFIWWPTRVERKLTWK